MKRTYNNTVALTLLKLLKNGNARKKIFPIKDSIKHVSIYFLFINWIVTN